MIRMRRDEPRCGNRRRRVFRRLDGTMDIPEYAPPRQHKTGRDGPDLFEDLMGKQRREQPQDSIFADNPFLDGLFEWMDSPEGQKSIEVRDVLWNLLEHAQLDAKQRKLIWPDGTARSGAIHSARPEKVPGLPPRRGRGVLTRLD